MGYGVIMFEEFFNQYVVTALWSSCDDSDTPLDSNYSMQDIDPETLEVMRGDCTAFMATIASDGLDGSWGREDYSRAGHDFWLTRNGHGAGFWDGDWEKTLGERLTQISKSFGTFDLYIGDDNLVHGS